MKNPAEEIYEQTVFRRIRDVHAASAERLATEGLKDTAHPGQLVYLVEDQELRDEFGHLLGQISASHNWSIGRVINEFAQAATASSTFPFWEVDSLRIAILLRCADAAHVDSSRAPTLEMLLAKPSGTSAEHWFFQNKLRLPTLNPQTQELVFQSSAPFTVEYIDAWWLAFDTLSNVVHAELAQADWVLREHRRHPQAARGVTGANDPTKLSTNVRTSGWEPINIQLSLSNIAGVIDRFGGRHLYGFNPAAAVRELLANACDAINARKALRKGGGQIVVRLVQGESAHWLEVEDDGVGMSRSVLQKMFLDFGQTFWRSELARSEFPGLASGSFEPTGKFGIGFFSVFILSDQVEVITRNFKDSISQTSRLEIKRNRSHQTLFSDADTEKISQAGTCVRLKLRESPWAVDGLFTQVNLKPIDDNLDQALESLVSYIAVALDVSVDTEIVTRAGEIRRQSVIRANDWLTMEFEKLLDRLAAKHIKREGPAWRYVPPKLSEYIAEPRQGTKKIGRFRLHEGARRRESRFCLSIGGFRAEWSSGRESHLEGLLVGQDPKLDRSEGTSVIDKEAFRMELAAAVKQGFLEHHSAQYDLANYLLALKTDPGSLKCFELAKVSGSLNAINAAQLADFVDRMKVGDLLVIVMGETFSFEDELGGSGDAEIYNELERLEFSENVISVRTYGYLLEFALKIVAGTWGTTPPEILSSTRVKLGNLSNGKELSADLSVMIRPS